jgi:hypothetical protein
VDVRARYADIQKASATLIILDYALILIVKSCYYVLKRWGGRKAERYVELLYLVIAL